MNWSLKAAEENAVKHLQSDTLNPNWQNMSVDTNATKRKKKISMMLQHGKLIFLFVLGNALKPAAVCPVSIELHCLNQVYPIVKWASVGLSDMNIK